MADVIAYSSCKGLFGLTGGSFVAFNNLPENNMNSFYLNIQNHLDSKMTGPYHTILSLHDVLQNYEDFKYSVKINKKRISKIMSENLIYPKENQPLLCTYIKKKLTSRNKKIIFYKTRANVSGSVVCHLGEAHLKRKAKGNIFLDRLRSNADNSFFESFSQNESHIAMASILCAYFSIDLIAESLFLLVILSDSM